MEQKALSFALVVPALNEQEAIGSTLERALAARRDVIERTPVRQMHVVFVNDGSTDNTQAIADRFPEVIKIRFERNQGYGAAIKAGFAATDAELVGFMDADGTCEPRFCVQLINHLLETGADVVVGSRMHQESQMPWVRRLGNWLFARLIGTLANKQVTDAASGMRVLRRASLRKMHPLPDGLHFTPAMTALALLDPRLKICEVPMPYQERTGQSKLRVIKDGFRFLFIILFTAALFSPIKSLGLMGLLFLLFGAGLAVVTGLLQPVSGVGLAWLVAYAVVFMQAVFVGFLCRQSLHMLIGPRLRSEFGETLLQKHFWTRRLVWAGVYMLAAALAAFAVCLFVPPPWQMVLGIAAALGVVVAGWTALAGVILRVIWAAKQRRIAELEDPFGAQGRSQA